MKESLTLDNDQGVCYSRSQFVSLADINSLYKVKKAKSRGS